MAKKFYRTAFCVALLLTACHSLCQETVLLEDNFPGDTLDPAWAKHLNSSISVSDGRVVLDNVAVATSHRAFIARKNDSAGKVSLLDGSAVYDFFAHDLSVELAVDRWAGEPARDNLRRIEYFAGICCDPVPHQMTSATAANGVFFLVEKLHNGENEYFRLMINERVNGQKDLKYIGLISGPPSKLCVSLSGCSWTLKMTGTVFTAGRFNGMSAASGTFETVQQDHFDEFYFSTGVVHSGPAVTAGSMDISSVRISVFPIARTENAAVGFSPLFNDGMVLQCGMPVTVWGTANSGETVTVAFADQKKTAVADKGGKWTVLLDPMEASFDLCSLTASVGDQHVEVSNVLVGEVWLATGQSNMVIPLSGSNNGVDRLKKTIPEIRFVKVPQRTGLPIEKKFTADELKWNDFKPGQNQQIAAVAFYFAEKLQASLECPVGIIQSSFGGTPCEAWTPAWMLDKHPELSCLADEIRKGLDSGKTKEEWVSVVEAESEWRIAMKKWARTKQGAAPPKPDFPGPDNPWSSKSPTVLYENMIAPLVPVTTRGVIWYQGESNAEKPAEYRILFPAMIDAWRTVWNRPEWPFLFVQISAFDHPFKTMDWPGIRETQTITRDTIPYTGMALSIDCGEKANIHPRAKQPVGERLARLALDQVYGLDVVSRGPVFQALEQAGSKIRVVFQYSEEGLQSSDGNAAVPGFEVAGTDGQFCAAEVKIVSADTIELVCSAVRNPVAVRYAWANWIEPPVTLQNSSGLPAEPFMRELDR